MQQLADMTAERDVLAAAKAARAERSHEVLSRAPAGHTRGQALAASVAAEPAAPQRTAPRPHLPP
jgi:hypothetical protein